MKRQVRDVANSARSLASGLRHQMNALAAAVGSAARGQDAAGDTREDSDSRHVDALGDVVVDGVEVPAPIKLSERVTAWRAEDVRAWIKAQGEGGDASG